MCVCTAWPSGRALLLDPLSCFLILLLLSGSSPQGITETLESLSKILMERQEGKASERYREVTDGEAGQDVTEAKKEEKIKTCNEINK